MKKGWIQANESGAYENVAPKTLADLVYMDEAQTRTVKQALQSSGGGNVTGSTTYENTYLGMNTGRNGLGMHNTFCGVSIGTNLESANENTIIGASAGRVMRTGNGNIFIGVDSGGMIEDSQENICIGNSAGMGSSYSRMDSIYIGNGSHSGYFEEETHNEIVIGRDAMGNGSNTVTLGNWETMQLHCQAGHISQMSDTRVKEEVQAADTERCLETVKSLPVTRYKYKDFTGRHLDTHVTGFLADDVEKVFPKSVTKRDRYFPVLDEHGEQVYEEVEETTEVLDENGEARMQTTKRKAAKMFLMTDVKDLTMTEAVPTLWGAMQALAARVEALENHK